MTASAQPLRITSSDWVLVIGWTLANLIGFGLIGAFFHNFPLAFTFPPNITQLRSFNFGAALFGGLAFGFVPALLPGFLQRLVLRRHLPVSRQWVLTISAGVGLMHFLSDGFESARDLSIAVLLSGSVVGVLQWRLLRPHLKLSGWWVGAVVLSWYLGWMLSFAILDALNLLNVPWVGGLDFKQHGLQGLTVGAANSLLGGATLLWLLHRKTAH